MLGLRILGLIVIMAAVPVAYAQEEPMAVPNGDFHQDLMGTWEAVGGPGERSWEPQFGNVAAGSLRLQATGASCGVAQSMDQAVSIQSGEGFKLTVWMKAEASTGATYAALELLRNGQSLGLIGKTREIAGSIPDWMPLWVVVDLPADSPATHLRVVLRSDANSGTVWFDDVSLKRLPPNRPVVEGGVAPPSRGPITAHGGHLVDGQGQRFRLWRVNCVDELGRDYREITQIVQRIKEMGFNAVRLHLYDYRLIDTDAKTAAGEPTSRAFRSGSSRGDGSLLDRMDYFIYRAERAGLYLYLTFDRGRARFGPGDYEVLPPAGEEDARQWKEAVAAANEGWANEHLCFVDERLAAAHAKYVRQQLDHRNAYTGVRIADDPYVALWELTNENGFPLVMLKGSFREWPEYFQKSVQRRWNAWLKERYGREEELRAAWGGLREGESLSEGSVVAAPADPEADGYPEARHADFRRFVYDLTLAHCRRLERILKEAGACSARTPVSYDTIYKHKPVWYYPMSQGSFQAVGQYVGGSLELKREDSWLGQPFLELYNYSMATVADKPIVVYEDNIHRPAADRAYYPLLISTFASTHDWDGVFWYVWSDGTVYDQVDAESYALNGLRYAAPSHIWHGIVIATDEVLLASLRLAGELFTRFMVPPALAPVTITVGANDLLGRTVWFGDLQIPFPPDAPGPYRRSYAMSATDFVYTSRYRYDLDQTESSASRPLIARTPEVFSPVESLTYDFQKGVIVVDRPEAQTVVGFTEGQWTFREGVSVEAENCPFFCYGLVSLVPHQGDSAKFG